MDTDLVVFLRGISNTPMQPLRDALSGIGLAEVRSFGGTGNLLFRTRDTDLPALEQRIESAVGVDAFIRSRSELVQVVAGDPFAGMPGASMFISHGIHDASRVESLFAGGFEGQPPVVSGAHVYFLHPVRRPGRRGIIDLERELGVRGTMRASRVVARVLELM